MGSIGAAYFETLTDVSGMVSKDQWDIMRFGMICSDPGVFAENKAVIEKLCYQTGNCTYEMKKQLELFFYNVNEIKKVRDERFHQ